MDENYFPEPAFMNKGTDELSQEQLFERIAYKIWEKYDGNISKNNAFEAARNATGFCKTLLEINTENARAQKSARAASSL